MLASRSTAEVGLRLGFRTVGYACHGNAPVSRHVDRVLVPVPVEKLRPVLIAAISCLGKANVIFSKLKLAVVRLDTAGFRPVPWSGQRRLI